MKNVDKHLDVIQTLPVNVKDKFLHLMAKRGKITDANVGKVIHDRTKYLDLSECDVGDVALNKLIVCKNLRVLDLNACKKQRKAVTLTGLDRLFSQCTFLQAVYLRRCVDVGDGAIVSLAIHCPLLVELNIGGCPMITDQSLEALGKSSAKLQSIQFSKTKVTDIGVYKLITGLCQLVLKEIVMDGCEHLTDESVEIVVTFCPNVSILVFHDCPKITDRSRQILGGLHSKVKQVMWTVY